MDQGSLPQAAQVVIIGGGIVGSSVAYHLTKLGWRDVLVVDKGDLPHNDGSTSHAPGGMHVVNPSKMMTTFAVQSVEIYSQLPDYEPGRRMVRRVGGLEVAYTQDRWRDLHRKLGWATAYGVEARLISPQETADLVPILDPKVILGSYYCPLDTNVIGVHVNGALAREAERTGGATFVPHTRVTDLQVQKGHITAVVTDRGTVQCEQAVLAANIWAPAITQKMGVVIPLLSAQHQYTVTTPIPALAEYAEERGGPEIAFPTMRHQDYSMYFRQHWDRWGVGSYRHDPLMVRPDRLGKTAIMPFTPEHFQTAWRAAVELFPALEGARLERAFNGMFAFTVDGFPILGETPLKGLWAAVGVWITHAGGVGKALAEWMTYGEPEVDVHEADMRRFLPHQLTRTYIDIRCAQNYREVYDIIHPAQPPTVPRGMRYTPVHKQMVDLDAYFQESAGFEMARWYGVNARLLHKYGERIPRRNGWEAMYWSPIQGAEHLAVRENVGLFNVSALAVIEVSGPGATAYLERLAANRIDRPVGKVVYTSFLTPRGGIMCDLTVVRLAEDRYWVITGGGLLAHDLAWMRAHLPQDGSVTLTDHSGTYAPLGLWGPNARRVLEQVTEDDVSNQAFPYYTARAIQVDVVPVVALRISYAGELGWELYARRDQTARLWDVLWEAGREFGLIAAGAGAFDSLRLEKGYRLWGADIDPEHNPYEAGLEWAVRLDKGDFIGREALLRIREEGVRRKLCCITFDTPKGMALGKEPIFVDDRCVGYVTSANTGYSVGKHIAYGYLPVAYATPGTQVAIEYFGERHPATVQADPLWDPSNARLKM